MEALAHGEHIVVCAPTGSGKTLDAFLWALDQLNTRAPGHGVGTVEKGAGRRHRWTRAAVRAILRLVATGSALSTIHVSSRLV
jgi:ATP-dependent helicase YprA (DUF1998 family)